MLPSAEPNDGTPEIEDGIVAAIHEWIESVREMMDALTAAGSINESWAVLVRDEVMPRLGAEFIATGAMAAPDTGVSRGDQLLAWPEGVQGPPTVAGLLAEYPATFAGVSAAQVAFVIASPTWMSRFTEYMRTTQNLVSGMADTTFSDMQRALAKVGQGAGMFDKQKVVREFLSWDEEGGYVGWMKRAQNIARTEAATARNTAAHAAALDLADAGLTVYKVWSCLVPDTPVAAHGVTAGARIHYEGPVVSVSTASGSTFTCTPEHRVLTGRGWVQAKTLSDGDYLVKVGGANTTGAPNVEDGVPVIGDLVDSAIDRAPVQVGSVPTGVYLHRDIGGKHVEVVGADRCLSSSAESGVFEGLGDACLVPADSLAHSLGLSGGGFCEPLGIFVSDNFGGSPPFGSEFLDLCGFSLDAEDSRLGHSPDVYGGFCEYPTDGGLTDTESCGYGALGVPCEVEADDVVGVEVREFSGLVYDLSTVSGWFLADGLIVHNCADDERTRQAHREADGQRREIHEPFMVGGEALDHPGDRVHGSAANTINCVIGSTRVAGPGQDVALGYRRPASGRFIELTLANGSVLTVTPNHPVLTPRGYVVAQLLREGDCLMATPISRQPDVDNVPPSIEQAFDAMRGLGVTRRVATSGLDFHGDATEQEEVEVVSANGELGDSLNAAFLGHFGEQALVKTLLAEGGTSSSGASDDGAGSVSGVASLPPDAPVSPGVVSVEREGSTFLGSEPLHPDAVSLGTGSYGKPRGFESANYGGSGASEVSSHLKDARALGMEPVEVVAANSHFGSHYVYNLETSRNYYIANGVIVHNCRCVESVIRAEDEAEANETLDWLEQFRGRSLADMEAEMDRMNEALTADGQSGFAWEGVLAPMGEPTGDGRVFDPDGEFRFRAFPLPLLWQESTGEGHDAARVVGTIDSGEITEAGVKATGTVFADEEKVLSLLDRGVIRPSVDLCDMVAQIDTYETDDDGGGAEGELLRVTSATVMAATLVAKPAFENVGIFLTGEKDEVPEGALVASAGVLTAPRYRAEAFADPGLEGPTPVTVTEDGRVFGHLALWDSCHIGMPGRCVKPPHSATGYAAFHQSTVQTEDGPLAVGRLTVGGGHATARAGVRAAAEHYDQTGAAWAMVRAGEDEYGIWVAGEVHPDATDAQVHAGMESPLSGDWRRVGEGMELVAALSVSTPGFPVRREYTNESGMSMSLVAAVAPVGEGNPGVSAGFSVSELSDDELDALALRMAPHLERRGRFSAAKSRMMEALKSPGDSKADRMKRAAMVFNEEEK